MCGIIAVVRRRSGAPPVALADLVERLEQAWGSIHGEGADALSLARAAGLVEEVDRRLRGVAGVQALLASLAALPRFEEHLDAFDTRVRDLEARLDAGELDVRGEALERLNGALVRLKDALWAIRCDRLRAGRAVAELAGAGAGLAAVEGFLSVHTALSALDRLEVRGRDSAGVHILVRDHGLDLDAADVRALLAERTGDRLFSSLSVRTPGGHLSFVYKAAAEIGELGDNTRALRASIAGDELLHRALAADSARALVLGHTRWASVGIISEPNAHPLNHEEDDGRAGPYVTASLNGDVDNYADLINAEGLCFPAEVTTDAKVIPALVSRRLTAGEELQDAFRHTVASFGGSVAIAASAADAPDTLLLALRGSGQALYVGLADDAFVVASEPYGLVEETPVYLRMDGETPSPSGASGQVVVLREAGAGTVAGIRRLAYDGTELPVGESDLHRAEITTRDIDRGGYPHFFLKEISEAPESLRKTLRGKLHERDGRVVADVADALPETVRARLASGELRRFFVIGQGTAAVAAQSVAASIADAMGDTPTWVQSLPATELSGFGLDDDMSDAVVVAISQSGTTTDTNRTVDLVRARGATVLAIVNRRNSDLVEKADGVLYTSDGRDVEMSVASTKAFYAQIAAGFLLASAIADAARAGERHRRTEVLTALRDLPAAMEKVLARRDELADAAARFAPPRRYWAVVGNGTNRIAAAEVRIKLSELCYKSIACDATEDKKHIDLSSEPLIFVCAAGLSGANADDVAKEVAIYRAHKAAPVVIATEGETRFGGALQTVAVPAVHPALAFVLSAMAGHLFGYEAALSIDAQARGLRELRGAVEAVVSEGSSHLLERLAELAPPAAARFFDDLRSGAFNGHLEASTAVRIASLLRYVVGAVPLDAYQLEHGKLGTPATVIEDFVNALTRGIEELTRPVDAIKHQAKTVTVGISRTEERLLEVPLVAAALHAGAPRDRLMYRALRSIAALDPAVAEVSGHTRYRIEGSVAEGTATAAVVDQGGVAVGLRSRTEANPALRGTKHRAAYEREVTVARGASDGRTVVLVPEVKDNQVTGMTLLHARFHDTLPPAATRAVLTGYRNRYGALVDAVTETEPRFDDSLLERVPLIDLLVQPVHVLAEHWRRA